MGKGKRGSPDEKTTWYRVSVWGREAEIAQQYIKKGTSIYVTGEFDPREYIDKSNARRVSYDIQFAHFTLLGGRPTQEQGAPYAPAAQDFDPDEIPI